MYFILLAPQVAEDGVGLDRLGQGGVDQGHAVHGVLAEEDVLLEQLAHLLGWIGSVLAFRQVPPFVHWFDASSRDQRCTDWRGRGKGGRCLSLAAELITLRPHRSAR